MADPTELAAEPAAEPAVSGAGASGFAGFAIKSKKKELGAGLIPAQKVEQEQQELVDAIDGNTISSVNKKQEGEMRTANHGRARAGAQWRQQFSRGLPQGASCS